MSCRVFVTLCLLVIAGLPTGSLARAALPFEEGEPFPVIALPSIEDGKPLSIADFRGQKVVLQVFASW